MLKLKLIIQYLFERQTLVSLAFLFLLGYFAINVYETSYFGSFAYSSRTVRS